jgi:hypothetical protein
MCPSVFAEEKAAKVSLTVRPLAKILIILKITQNN